MGQRNMGGLSCDKGDIDGEGGHRGGCESNVQRMDFIDDSLLGRGGRDRWAVCGYSFRPYDTQICRFDVEVGTVCELLDVAVADVVMGVWEVVVVDIMSTCECFSEVG